MGLMYLFRRWWLYRCIHWAEQDIAGLEQQRERDAKQITVYRKHINALRVELALLQPARTE